MALMPLREVIRVSSLSAPKEALPTEKWQPLNLRACVLRPWETAFSALRRQQSPQRQSFSFSWAISGSAHCLLIASSNFFILGMAPSSNRSAGNRGTSKGINTECVPPRMTNGMKKDVTGRRERKKGLLSCCGGDPQRSFHCFPCLIRVILCHSTCNLLCF